MIHFDLANKEKRIAELERNLEEPDFWNDADKSTAIVRELKNLKDTVEQFRRLEREYREIGELIEMGYEEEDPETVEIVEEMMTTTKSERTTRVIDFDQDASMEQKKREGYF